LETFGVCSSIMIISSAGPGPAGRAGGFPIHGGGGGGGGPPRPPCGGGGGGLGPPPLRGRFPGSTSITFTPSEADLGGSGIGHMCIVMAQSGSIIVSHTCGRMISPFGPTRS
jgi:hypothetical protein